MAWCRSKFPSFDHPPRRLESEESIRRRFREAFQMHTFCPPLRGPGGGVFCDATWPVDRASPAVGVDNRLLDDVVLVVVKTPGSVPG